MSVSNEAFQVSVDAKNAEIEKLKVALKGLSEMYSSAFDLVDGGLIMLPPSIPRFEAAHKAAREALGVFWLEAEDEE